VERMVDIMKRKTYNNVVKVTKMIQKKAYSLDEANEMAIRLFDENTKDMNSIEFYIDLVSKKFVSFKKPMNPSKFQTHPAVLELFALCAIPAVSLKGRKNTSANNA